MSDSGTATSDSAAQGSTAGVRRKRNGNSSSSNAPIMTLDQPRAEEGNLPSSSSAGPSPTSKTSRRLSNSGVNFPKSPAIGLNSCPPAAAGSCVPMVSPMTLPEASSKTPRTGGGVGDSAAAVGGVSSPSTHGSSSSAAAAGPPPEDMEGAMKALWKVALPASGSSLFMMLPGLITTTFIGHRLPNGTLSALGVSITTFNLFGFSIGIGFISALDTFASQAFGRDPKSKELGILLQRSLFIVMCLAIPVLVILSFSKVIVATIFSPTLAEPSHEYLGHSHLFLLSLFVNASLMSVIGACRLTHLPLYANVTSTVCSLILSYLFLDSLKTTVYILFANTMVGNAVMIYFVLKHPELEGVRSAKWWPLSEIEVHKVITLEHVKQYMRVGIPAMIAVCSEWWAFEAQAVVAAHVSDEAVGVLNVIFSVFTFFFLTASGLSRGTSVVVGNSLGAGKTDIAKMSLKCALYTVLATNVVTAAIIYLAGSKLWELFTEDPNILQHADRLAPWMAAANFLDGLQYVLQGGYRGVGKQDEAASRCLGSLWMIGVPSSYFLAMKAGFGVDGVVYGLLLGLAAEVPLLYERTTKWDWDELTKAAQESAVGDEKADETATGSVKKDQGSEKEGHSNGQFPSTEFDDDQREKKSEKKDHEEEGMTSPAATDPSANIDQERTENCPDELEKRAGASEPETKTDGDKEKKKSEVEHDPLESSGEF